MRARRRILPPIMRALIVVGASLVLFVASARGVNARQLYPYSDLPVGATFNKGICVTYTIKGEVTQIAVAYPSGISYMAIGESGAYWLYPVANSRDGHALRVDSLVISPLYKPSDWDGLPYSCTPFP